ncbi:60S ribosomal protein L18a-like protein [Iris pallida]|uniref:60S ribosomal protein L18a-like protein n=1 Tax=Iris pallida TaxID=29817 RepID=A0AAX6DP66_IRIPA|nr:60S ribosomal protein L18a-like protein [Iris pallida]
MSDEEKKGHDHHLHLSHHHHHDHQQQQQQQQYGTFEAGGPPGPLYPPPRPPQHDRPPAIGFPQPVPPPGASAYYAHAYQAVPGFAAVAEGRPVRERRLRCCGIGLGWFLFIIGFFFAAIPWYIGAFVMLCVRGVDHREKPGYVACTIAAVIAAIAVIIGATKGADVW